MQNRMKLRSMLAVVLAMLLLAGCASGGGGQGASGDTPAPTKAPASTGSSSGSDSSGGDAAKPEEPITLKVLTSLYGNPPKEENNQAKLDFEKRGNVKLDIEFVPADAYADKLSVALASKTGYDLILFEGKSDKYVSLAKQGAFHDLEPFLEGKENLLYTPQPVWENTKVGGKLYGIPRPRGLYGGGEASFIMRKDWLDKLGLEVPKTIDDLTNVLRAFRDNDPAGDGKTIPMNAFARDEHVFGATSAVFYAFGVPNYYTIDNGEPKYLAQTPQYKQYLDWLRMAYAEGLIDKDAPILKQQQAREKFYSGIGGAYVFHVGALNDGNYDLMRKSAEGAELVVVPPLEGPGGRNTSLESGYFGLWVIPSSVPKEKAEKIVEFLDFSASEENFIFSKAGVIGIHSEKFENGVAVQTDAQKELTVAEIPSAFVLQNRYDPYNYAQSTDPEISKYQKEQLDILATVNGIANPFSGLNSPTMAQNPDHLKGVHSMSLKYVMGEAEWDEVQKEIDAWANGIGGTILSEFMEQYESLQ